MKSGHCVKALLWGFICAAGVLAQDTARLLGTVTDQSGAAVTGAKITARNMATGIERTTLADSAGGYSIPLLPIGAYSITGEATGFKTTTLGGITLQVGQEARVDIRLEIGATSDSIDVTAAAPLLETDTSAVGQVIDSKAMANLPLNGRQFWQLAQLTPGTVFTPGGQDITSGGQGIRASRVQLRISGNSRLSSGWLLDGFDITEYEQGGTSLAPSTDALEEFRVLGGGMSAEYRLPSVVNAALKSGTNSFNGSLYEYIRNDNFQARNFFARNVPELKRTSSALPLVDPSSGTGYSFSVTMRAAAPGKARHKILRCLRLPNWLGTSPGNGRSTTRSQHARIRRIRASSFATHFPATRFRQAAYLHRLLTFCPGFQRPTPAGISSCIHPRSRLIRISSISKSRPDSRTTIV